VQGDGALVDELRRLLGLSSYEARAYLAVLRGTHRPRDIARESGVPLQRVYDVLARLEERGLVARTPDGFYAVEPREAMRTAAERTIAEAKLRARDLERLAERLQAQTETARGYVRLAPGLAEAVAAALEALSRCRGGEVWVLAYKAAERAADLRPVLEEVLARLPRGARILVSTDARLEPEPVEEVKGRGFDVRRSPAVLMDMLAACDTTVIGLPSGDDDAVAVVVRNNVFAEGLRRRLRGIWAHAEPL
jgi:sugar-specific transcriptional regulator TrmB